MRTVRVSSRECTLLTGTLCFYLTFTHMLPMLQNLLPGPDQLPVKWLRLLALDIKVQETSFMTVFRVAGKKNSCSSSMLSLTLELITV